MYTRKLLKNNITVGNVLGAVAMLLAIIFFFKYMSFQDAKQDIDEMISDHGVLTAEDKDKIDLFQPTLFMILGGSLAFGAAVYVQMFMMSLQMNVSRKHLNIANLISQVVFSVFIVGTLVAGQICSGLLFSELCKDKYEWLSGKYRDMMFDLRLSGRSTSSFAQCVAASLALAFAAAVVGTLLVQVLQKYKGGELALLLTVPPSVVLCLFIVLLIFKLTLVAMLAFVGLIVLMLIAQWRMTKSHTIELMSVKAVH